MKKTLAILLSIISSLAFAEATPLVDSDGVPTSFSQIGKIPTYNYSIPASQMIELLTQDINEKRTHLSTTKGSHLDKYIESTENIPNGIKKSSNSFAANSTGKICVTVVNINVSSSFSTSGAQGSLASNTITRNCSPLDGVSYGYSQWARSTIDTINVTAPQSGLKALYNAAGIINRYNPNGATSSVGFRGAAFSSSAFGVNQEAWGVTLFNTYGITGTAQEIVLIVAAWV